MESPPAKVEVAVEVEVIDPTVSLPIEEEAKKESTILPRVEKREVVVAFVMVARTKVESVRVEVAVMTPVTREPIEEEERKESVKRPRVLKKVVEVAFSMVTPPLLPITKAVVVAPLVASATTWKRL